MLPEQPISFPEFVADQLLTAKNLNDLFHYLDVQERGTRTNLIGIGIVCGLELKVNSSGTEVTITKGCGITSQGYLVRWDERKFDSYKAYNAAKEIVYDSFYAGSKAKLEVIDELKADASEEGIVKLSKAYLEDKVALLFVELERIDAKNCDPESCDDKGSNITLTIRPLLVSKKDAASLTGGVAGGAAFGQTWLSLPELHMPRHHVPATDIFDSGHVFQGFQQVLNASFLGSLEKTLSAVFKRLQPIVGDLYPAGNPFGGMANEFAFIYNGTITVQQLLYMQYYYDLFSDVVYAYEELRKVGMKLLSLCCPDEGLFPRHLLLGLTGSAAAKAKLDFRHYFIPSPAQCCHGDLVAELRSLFKRLVLLLQRFSLQSDAQVGVFQQEAPQLNAIANFTRGSNVMPIRVTPSKHGDVPLSQKAIPFYYNAASGADKIFEQWNFMRTRNGSADQNLSYNARQYNAGDDAVLSAIQYDLEPYNFLRIEGHVGHSYTDALATINQIRDANRLPFDVVALSADVATLRETLASIASSTSSAGLRQGVAGDIAVGCHFQDLEALYDTMAQGFICNLCKEMKYYYPFPVQFRDTTTTEHVPQAPLLKKCDPAFRYTDNTLGDAFEEFFAKLPAGGYIQPEQFFGGTSFGSFSQKTLSNQSSANNGTLLGIALLYYIEKMSEILPTTLSSFNISAFQTRYADLMSVAEQAKLFHQMASTASAQEGNELLLAISEDVIDHLDSLIQSCRDAQFAALYSDYRIRWVYLAMLQKLGYYVKMHPGIQHKAGVTMGGTFILVYHERSRLTRGDKTIFTRNAATGETVASRAQTLNAATRAASPAPAAAAPAPEADTTASALQEMQAKAQASDTSKDVDTEKTIAADQTITAAKAKQTAAFRQTYQISTTKLKATLTAKQMAIIDKLFFKDLITRHSLDELTAQLPDKIVIADFYLPYMNCSDCPPVYYIVNETAENDPEQPTVAIKQAEYCGEDKTAYELTVTPAGGAFGTSEGVTEQNGAFSFNPSAVNIGDGELNKIVALTYTKDGLSATVNVTVFAKPNAAFEIIPATTYNFFVFSNKSERTSTFAWDFGDEVTSSLENPSHVYAEDGTYVVRLTVKNGVCSDTMETQINVVKASISIDGSSFCSADKEAHNIQVSPQGGSISGEGASQADDGAFVFQPGTVPFATSLSFKDVLLGYQLGSQLVQTTVRVFRTPSASFTVSNGSTALIKNFQTNNAFTAQYLWSFGDGKTAVEANPSHQFAAPGTYVVSLTVSNDSCQDTSSQTITIIQTSVSITPAIFCSNISQGVPIVASPASGTITGEGTSGGNGNFLFTPSAVAFTTGQSQKVITIGYNATGSSAQTQVTVFRTPNAAFEVTQGTISARSKNFTSNVGFDATYAWDFGDGTNANVPNPSHTYTTDGDFNVSLTVSNGQCPANSSKIVTVKSETPVPQKTCGPLSGVLASFDNLQQAAPEQFAAFTKTFKSYGDIQKYMKSLADIATQPSDAQLQLFINTGLQDLLTQWFTELNPLVVNSNVRQLALMMWSVLTSLLAYAECIQTTDVKDGKPNFAALMDTIERFVKSWEKSVSNFSAAEREALNQLLQLLITERNRVITNREDKLKPDYLQRLENLIAILTGYLH